MITTIYGRKFYKIDAMLFDKIVSHNPNWETRNTFTSDFEYMEYVLPLVDGVHAFSSKCESCGVTIGSLCNTCTDRDCNRYSNIQYGSIKFNPYP